MKKIIKLTERDLTRIVRRIVEETESESKGVSKKGSLKDIAKKKFNSKEYFMDVYEMTQNPDTEWKIISAENAKIAGVTKNLEGKIIKSSDFIDLTSGGDVTLDGRKKSIGGHLWVKLGKDGSIGCSMLTD